MDTSGIWTVALRRCDAARGEPGLVKREFPTEADARTAVRLIYALSQYLIDAPTWNPETTATGRWRIRAVEPSPQDLQFRLRTARTRTTATTRSPRPT